MESLKEIKSLKIVFVFILILIVGIGVASYRNIRVVYDTAEWRTNSYNILTFIEDLHTQIIGVEEYQRNYVITGDTNYIYSFYKGIKNVNVDLNNLRILFKDNDVQLKRINKLDSLISIKFKSFESEISMRTHGNYLEAITLLKQWISKKSMDQISEQMSIIHAEEYSQLQKKDQILVVNVKNTFYTIIVGTLVSCIIFLTVFYLLDREINFRKKVEQDIRREMEFSERLLNSSIDGIFAFDKNCNYTLWNPGMESMTGISKSEAVGSLAFNVLPFLKEIGEDKYFYETLKGNSIIAKDRWFYIPDNDREGYFEAYYSPIFDLSKNVVGGIAIIRDSTQRKFALEALERAKGDLEKRVMERTAALSKVNEDLRNEIIERKKAQEKINASLQEKLVLLREIHHRVKNNLQVISSLLNLQSGYIEDKKSLEIFRESQNRIRSMALIHEKLYQSKDLNKIEFSEYINSLTKDLFDSYNIDPRKISLKTDFKGIFLEIDTAILCGLIINELISNALKHAFPDGKSGEVFISLYSHPPANLAGENNYTLIFRDNGIGFPEGLDFRKSDSLGLKLVTALTDQLGGEIKLNTTGQTEFMVLFSA
ncbi:MAG: histidine kinase dimerization/phosphoacceptor domain -containing protein [Ignavibacteriaceae bacterium]